MLYGLKQGDNSIHNPVSGREILVRMPIRQDRGTNMTAAAPKLERFSSIDTLRGVAVLGILMMNIQAFAMHANAYQYPLAHMDFTGANQTVWWIAFTFFEVKFITIFSTLFGAGIALMLGDDRSQGTRQHYPRMLWLLAFGLVHAYIFWFGDILVAYALVGMVAVLLRGLPVAKLLFWGLFAIAINGLIFIGIFSTFNLIPGEIDPVAMGMAPSAEDLQDTVALYQAGFIDRLPYNAGFAALGQVMGLIFFGARTFGLMLIGMALFKSGFLTARWSMPIYLLCAAIGLGVGLPIAGWAGNAAIADNFDLAHMWKHQGANYVASLFVSFGYASVVMLLSKISAFKLILYPFTAAGRMAFTNYLSQTLIMTYLFVGPPGLGWFGTLERVEQAQLVVTVWVGQLIFSVLWLSLFRFGPFEWLWRSLTYGRLQPILKSRDAVPAAGPPGG